MKTNNKRKGEREKKIIIMMEEYKKRLEIKNDSKKYHSFPSAQYLN